MYELKNKSELPHQQRVIEEANELGIKLTALNKFIYGSTFYLSLDISEQEILTKQSGIMLSYFEVLKERVEAF